MRRPTAPAGLTALVTAVVTAAALVPGLAPGPAGADAVVDDLTTFDDAYPRLAREGFESSSVPPTGVVSCDGPLSSAAASPCFPRAALRAGVRYLVEPDEGSDDFAVFGAGWAENSSTVLAVDPLAAALVLDFTVPVDTVGFRLGGFLGDGDCELVVRYVDASAPTTRTVPCEPDLAKPDFVGIKADRLIDSVRVADTTGEGAEVVDDLRFGLRAPHAFTVAGVRQQPATGTAALSVRVPAVGTTTVAGAAVVRASVDAARPRTVVLPVAARGSALRTLRQRGRVTVRVAVTFHPLGGTARSRTVPVTLVLRR